MILRRNFVETCRPELYSEQWQRTATTPEIRNFYVRKSRLPAKRAIIIQVHQVEPGVNILAQWIELLHLIRKFNQCLGVTVRRAAQMKLAPRGDFPRLTLMFRVGLNPRQHVEITAAFREFCLQRFVVEADEVEKMPVHAAAAVTVFAEFAGERRAAFVEDARQQNVTAQPHTRTARRALCKIR
jgi:hypothetical protein